jgi:adenosylmethionine-8-amino-7-oxononanoate aminotransferase
MSFDSAALCALDRRLLWHPYTQMRDHGVSQPLLVIERAAGARLYDAEGRSYLDGNASWWTSLLGHGHPRLVDALRRQAGQLCHVPLAGITHQPAIELARALLEVAPSGLTRVFYSDDGSTAVEAAIKLALQYWSQNGRPERRRFVALDGAFHGETLGATALSGVEIFRRPFASVVMDCVHVPSAADGYERAFAAIEQVLEQHSAEIAAVVLEPMIQAAAGMRVYPAEYLRRVRELTTRHDVLLVLDEVFTGYGRTGTMFASEHAGIAPDLMCVAKGFTGGVLPMAATLASERLFEGFLGERSRAFLHGHTFCGNPLGASVAREVLRIYHDERILEHAAPKAASIARAFARFASLPGVRSVRSFGMMGALELAETDAGYLGASGWRVYREALQRGAYLRPLGNVVYVTPCLNIPDSDLEELLAIVEASLAAA